MKKFLPLVVLFTLIFACKSTKTADSAVGSWDYIVRGTPNGDVSGYFTLAKEGDYYTGTIYSDQGSNSLRDVSIEDNTLTCNFNFQGYKILMTGTFDGNVMNGKVSVDYNDFTLTATKRE